MKITLTWGETSVDLNTPVVVPGAGVGAVSVAVPASLADKIRTGDGPRPVDISGIVQPGLGDEVGIVSASDGGPLVRWARVASDPAFGGVPGAVAVDRRVPGDHAGAPVFCFGEAEPSFCGLVQPVDDSTAVVLPPTAIRDIIPPK